MTDRRCIHHDRQGYRCYVDAMEGGNYCPLHEDERRQGIRCCGDEVMKSPQRKRSMGFLCFMTIITSILTGCLTQSFGLGLVMVFLCSIIVESTK